MKRLQSHRDPPGCSLCVRLSSRLRLFITMETLSGAFNGGKEVSSLAFLTHTHRLFSGAIIISERTAGMTLPLCTESLSPRTASPSVVFWSALPPLPITTGSQNLFPLLFPHLFSLFLLTLNLVFGKADHLETTPLRHSIPSTEQTEG